MGGECDRIQSYLIQLKAAVDEPDSRSDSPKFCQLWWMKYTVNLCEKFRSNTCKKYKSSQLTSMVPSLVTSRGNTVSRSPCCSFRLDKLLALLGSLHVAITLPSGFLSSSCLTCEFKPLLTKSNSHHKAHYCSRNERTKALSRKRLSLTPLRLLIHHITTVHNQTEKSTKQTSGSIKTPNEISRKAGANAFFERQKLTNSRPIPRERNHTNIQQTALAYITITHSSHHYSSQLNRQFYKKNIQKHQDSEIQRIAAANAFFERQKLKQI